MGVWNGSGGCLKGVWRVSMVCANGMCEWYVGCLDVSEEKSGLIKL